MFPFVNDGLTIAKLMKASHQNVKRLATWLGLRNIEAYSHKQLAKLVRWRTTRRIERQ